MPFVGGLTTDVDIVEAARPDARRTLAFEPGPSGARLERGLRPTVDDARPAWRPCHGQWGCRKQHPPEARP